MSALPDYIQRWLDNPDGGSHPYFAEQADLLLAHDPFCESLRDAWLPRRGGVTALGDISECQVCEATFLWEGLIPAFRDCQVSHHWFCHCCLVKTRVVCPCRAETEAGEP